MALNQAIDHCQLVIANCFAGEESLACETIGNDQLAMVN